MRLDGSKSQTESSAPTPYPDLNEVLRLFVTQVQEVLGEQFVGAYLQGSFALGDFDEHSDVDFTIAVEDPVSEAHLAALQAMHARTFALDSSWAQHLEGSYFSRALLRRDDPDRTLLPYLDNGASRLVPSDHDNELVVRWVVREHGITLAGPDPESLIDPIPVEALRREVRQTMRAWASAILAGRYDIDNRWSQPFVVVSYCRMLQTLETGRIHSKRAGVDWAERVLDSRWRDLIRRAWADRPDPSLKCKLPADADDIDQMVAFVRHALNESGALAP